MNGATLAAAEAAMELLAARLAHLPELRGMGIAVLEHGFAVKLNLSRTPEGTVMPDDVDGVPVIVDIVGTIDPLER